MAVPRQNNLRVMLDANVLIAGLGWPRFPYEALRHIVAGDVQLVLSSFIIDEARTHITRLFPDFLYPDDEFLQASGYEEIASPSKEEVALHQGLVRDSADIPVALSAIQAQVDYLITQDKDFTDPNERLHQQLKLILPGTFLREHMGWSSEQLETIRSRTWKDLAKNE